MTIDHLSIDEAVLTGDKGAALAKKIVGLVTKPYPGRPKAKQ